MGRAHPRQVGPLDHTQQLLAETVRRQEEMVELMNAQKEAGRANEQKKLQKAAVSRTVETAEALFRAGKASYLEVLVAQQNTLEADLNLIDRLKERQMAAVNLYRALGGGRRDAR